MTLDLRLAVPVVVAWVSVGALLAFPWLLPGVAIALWATVILLSCAAGLLAARRRGLVIGLALVLAAAALLVSVAAILSPHRQPDLLTEAAGAGRFVTASAVTTETLHPARGPFSVTLTSVSVGRKSLKVDIPVMVFGGTPTVTAPGEDSTVGISSTIRLAGTMAQTDPADDIAFLFFASPEPTIASRPPWFIDWANGLRARFRDAAATLPGSGGELLPGLAIGDTSRVGAPLDSAMKATSLSHLTAVSGANCAVVIALIMLAGASLGIPRGWRVTTSVIVLLGFVVLVTPEPSVLRAAVMATIVLVSMVGGRPVRGVPTLALAVLILLAIDPWLSRSYGFILSVLATAGLLVLSGPLTRVLNRWLPFALSAMLAIPLAAQLACQPVLILLNPTIPVFGVVANVLAEPAAPVATVLGLVACLLLPLLPSVGQFVAQLAWVPSAWIAAVAQFFAGLPMNSIPWAAGAIGVIATGVVTVLGLVVLLRSNDRGRGVRRIASIALAIVLVGYLGIAGGEKLRGQLSRPADWQIAACDIGQGDAVLVRSLDQVALIDTGPDPGLLVKCLDTLGIDRVNLLILTHYDLDHLGGTAAVFGRVDRAMIGPPDGDKGEKIVTQLTEGGAMVEQVSRGLSGRLGELRWEILWPRERLGSVEPGNDASMAVRFSGVEACVTGCLTSIFLADLGDQPQALMAAANRIGQVDVVKVAHHGSADQNERLYAKLQATVGVISVGIGNSYGHPTDRLLGILGGNGTLATRTDLEGMILLSPRPDGTVIVWTERPLPAGKLTAR